MPAHRNKNKSFRLTLGELDELIKWAVDNKYPQRMIDSLLDSRLRFTKDEDSHRGEVA